MRKLQPHANSMELQIFEQLRSNTLSGGKHAMPGLVEIKSNLRKCIIIELQNCKLFWPGNLGLGIILVPNLRKYLISIKVSEVQIFAIFIILSKSE